VALQDKKSLEFDIKEDFKGTIGAGQTNITV